MECWVAGKSLGGKQVKDLSFGLFVCLLLLVISLYASWSYFERVVHSLENGAFDEFMLKMRC